MIKNTTKLMIVFLSLILTFGTYAQDNRRLETKVADILAQFPSQNSDYTQKLMLQIIETGAPGIAKFCDMIIPAGTGDDTQARTAIESLSQYAGAPKHETERKLVESSLIAALQKATDNEVKAYFIRSLQHCGGAEAVAAMKNYINNDVLYEPALAVAANIGGDEAGKLVLESAQGKSGKQLLSMVKTLGQMKYQPAENFLLNLAQTAKNDLLKHVYASLANIGGKASGKTLATAAKTVNYQYDSTEAMISYLWYATRLAEQGETKSANQIGATVLKNCTTDNQLTYRALAMSIPGFGTNALFLKEFQNKNKAYRNAVLTQAAKQMTTTGLTPWIAAFKKAPAESQSEIIYCFANRTETAVLNEIIVPALSSSNSMVRTEAIRALAINQKTKAVPVLLEQLKKAKDAEEFAEIEKALLNTCSAKENGQLAAQLNNAGDEGKVVIINVLSARRANETFDTMTKLSQSSNTAISTAAFSALANVSQAGNAANLVALLKKTNDKNQIENIQKALVAIYSGTTKPDAGLILAEMQNSEQIGKFIPILSSLNDPKALKTVVGLLKKGNQAEREAAFVSLSTWADTKAAPHLFDLFADPDNKQFRDKSLQSYLRITLESNLPDDQKLLMIEKLMPECKTVAEKASVINATRNVKTFLALVFVAPYIDDSELSAVAAATAKILALPSSGKKNGLSGEFVAEVLTKVMGKMTGPDSQYDVIDVREYLEKMPKGKGFVSMFNGKDLSGWQGLVKNPVARAKMTPAELAKEQKAADIKMTENWSVKDGCIVFNGAGDNLCSKKMYGDFEMIVDWRITKNGDSGIYLRGSPQVQIWDTARVDVGAQVGSGGLYNNQKNPSKPLVLADNAIGDWNTFRIKMVGERVTVFLNGILVVDDVIMENYWDRTQPIFPKDAIELQAHGTDLAFRNIFVKELNVEEAQLSDQEKAEGFNLLFNGKNLDNWQGNKIDYTAEDGMILVKPREGSHGNLYTNKEYSNFIFRFEFQLTPGANNGLGIHAPLEGDAAYLGKELQILDNTAEIYKDLQPYQYHGSVYGIIPAKRGFLKPVGEWNYQEVIVQGDDIKITLNGTVIVDGNIKEASKNGTPDHKNHPGLQRYKGYIGFLGHGSELKFRNIRIKEL